MAVLVIVAGCAVGAPRETDPPEITQRPTPLPVTSASPAESSSPEATTQPTPVPTIDTAALALDAISCHGGVALDWTPTTHPDFHHYTALRSPQREIAPDYPPLAPAVDWGDTYTTDRFVTAAVDASIIPSDTRWNYRVMAYDDRNRPIAASPVRVARLREPSGLGPLQVGAGADGVTRLSWRAYDGDPRCFSAYRILAASGGAALETLAVVSDQAADSIDTQALSSGTAYQLQVQAVHTTTLGGFVLGETDTVTFTVP